MFCMAACTLLTSPFDTDNCSASLHTFFMTVFASLSIGLYPFYTDSTPSITVIVVHILYFDFFFTKNPLTRQAVVQGNINYLISISDPEIPGLVISKESRI